MVFANLVAALHDDVAVDRIIAAPVETDAAEVQSAVDAGWIPMEEVQRRLQRSSQMQLMDAMILMGREYDQLLKHLIRHREHALEAGEGDRTPLLVGFTDRPALLDLAVAAIEGKDAELRLLTLRLPPYDELGDLPANAAALKVEEPFLTALRGSDPDLYEREPEAREGLPRA